MSSNFGKGIESLIPKKNIKVKTDSKGKKEAIFYIEIDKVKPNPSQPRKDFKKEDLKELAESIRSYGIIQPLIASRVQKEGKAEYRLIAGERRYLSARMAGLTEVPVIVKEPTEREELEISIIENVQRSDLNPIEKAEAFLRLQEEFGLIQKDIAKVCSMSREAVANSLRILKLPEKVKQGIKEKKISEGHAKVIMGLKENDKKESLFEKIIKEGLSVRDSEAFAQRINDASGRIKGKTGIKNKEFEDLEKRFKEIIPFKTLKIGVSSGRPKLIIPFKDKKEAESFLKKFKS
jgi:ParB family transcriptional regulator, chromosome partitioning protein